MRPTRTSPRNARRRRGFTVLEAEIAFVLFGIALAGILPLVVVQLKLSRRLGRANPRADEAMTVAATPYLSPDRTFYLVPQTPTDLGGSGSVDPSRTLWLRKLGASAALRASDSPFSDANLATPNPDPTSKSVTILGAPTRSAADDSVSVRVLVK